MRSKKTRGVQRESRRQRREPQITHKESGFFFDRKDGKFKSNNAALILTDNPSKMVDSYSDMSEFFEDKFLNRNFSVTLSPAGAPTKVSVNKCKIAFCWTDSHPQSPADRFFISPRGVVYPACFGCLNKTRLHHTDRKFSNAATSMSFEEFSEVLSRDLPEGSEKVQVVSELDEEPWVRGVKKEGEYFILTAEHLLNAVAIAGVSLLLVVLFIQFMF